MTTSSPSARTVIGAPMEGKHFLYMTKPHSEWILGRLSDERPLRPIFMREHVFHSLEDAEWFVFKLRWEKLTGSPLDLD